MKIEIRQLTKIIRGQTVLDNISMEMVSGQIYGLHGINGSGKTMLMRAILGLIRPTSGEIVMDGRILGKDMQFPDHVGFLLESPSFLGRYSGEENLRLLQEIDGPIDKGKIRFYLEMVGLDPEDKKKYRKYSLGMKQRLGIAAAMIGNPQLLILDEPVNALDQSGVMMVRELLEEERKKGTLIILACHEPYFLRDLSDVICHMENGRIIGQERMFKGGEIL